MLVEPNNELRRKSIIAELIDTYAKYKEAIYKQLMYTGFNTNGEFFTLDEFEKWSKEARRLHEKQIKLQLELATLDICIHRQEEKR